MPYNIGHDPSYFNTPIDKDTYDEVNNLKGNIKKDTRMYAVEKKFHFAAAHALETLSDDHPCGAIHGHNVVLTVRIEHNELNDNGFVVDFKIVSDYMKEIVDKIDHSTIIIQNSIDKYSDRRLFKKLFILPIWCRNTSSEILCEYFHDEVARILVKNKITYRRIIVRYSESDNNLAEYTE